MLHKTTRQLNPERYEELDALRGIAALFVLLFHYSVINGDAFNIFKYGITGVDLFFLISGFVIFMSVTKVKSGGEFLVNRVSRLFPTYWVAVTFTSVVILLTQHFILKLSVQPNWEYYFYNMTMFQHYFDIPDLDGPYWTMIIEMLFYLIMVLLISTRSLSFTVTFLVILMLFGTILSEFYGGDTFRIDCFKMFPLAPFVPLFLAGILFYRLRTKTSRSKLFDIVLILICYLLQVLFYKSTRAHLYIAHSDYKLVTGIYFLLMFLFAFRKMFWIVNPVTMYLGKISFALYLIHQYVSIFCIIPNLQKIGVSYWVAAYLVALPVCIILASLITFYVEKTAIPRLRKLLGKLLPENLEKQLPIAVFLRKEK